jgi:glycosyltransferase involved in cell wall biosynthesis
MSATVSVVIPVYNGAKLIAATLRSVLAQSVTPDEIIVVNDGSTDGTAQELQRFGNSIRVISIPNGGVSNARNVGIEAASSDYIAFMDADDLWKPKKLEMQLSVLKAFSDVGFSCCNFLVLNGAGNMVPHFDQFRHRRLQHEVVFDRPVSNALEVLIQGNIVGTCSNVIAKRAVLLSAGLFDRRFRQTEDYDLWLRCAAQTPFLFQSDVLLSKISHETNLTNNFLETLQYHEQVLELFAQSEVIRTRAHLLPAVQQSLAEVRYMIGNRLFNRGKNAQGFGYFGRALGGHPSLRNLVYYVRHMATKCARVLLEALKLRTPRRD